MKKLYAILLSGIFLLLACSNLQSQSSKNKLTPSEFKAKLNQTESVTLIDVRTEDEFNKGHLDNALNFDWNGENFETQISTLDKTKPVFVYCLSGGRSSSAVDKMRSSGFQEIYELKGGILKWRAENLPESSTSKVDGMSKADFDALLNNEKTVLIDFYADWCAPCKKMKPYLEEISNEMQQSVRVVRINADDNQNLCKQLNIDALPVLQVYKNKTLVWKNEGFIEKEKVVKQLISVK
jgi:thioredoxin 1